MYQRELSELLEATLLLLEDTRGSAAAAGGPEGRHNRRYKVAPFGKECMGLQEHIPESLQPPLVDPEASIPRAAEVLFACSPSERYALVHRAFAPDCFYYNSFVRLTAALHRVCPCIVQCHCPCLWA